MRLDDERESSNFEVQSGRGGFGGGLGGGLGMLLPFIGSRFGCGGIVVALAGLFGAGAIVLHTWRRARAPRGDADLPPLDAVG